MRPLLRVKTTKAAKVSAKMIVAINCRTRARASKWH